MNINPNKPKTIKTPGSTDETSSKEITKQKLLDSYEKENSIEISNSEGFSCLNELIKSGKISLEKVVEFNIMPGSSRNIVDQSKLVNNVISFLSEKGKEFEKLKALRIIPQIQGDLTIPTFEFPLEYLQIGTVEGNVIIKSQPKLTEIFIDTTRHGCLTIEKQNELEKLEVSRLENKDFAIQPKLEAISIIDCRPDLELQDYPSLVSINMDVLSGTLSVNEKQFNDNKLSNVNKEDRYGKIESGVKRTFKPNGRIVIAKSQAELA